MDREALSSCLAANNLSEFEDQIQNAALECVYLRTRKADDHSLPVGSSKLGGDPDVPAGFEWPSWKGTKLAFLAQINLADVAQIPGSGSIPVVEQLPKSGLLSFFYHPEQGTWGFDPADRGSWRSYFFSDTGLQRMATPVPLTEWNVPPYPACRVVLETGLSLPPDSHGFFETGIQLPDNRRENYMEALQKIKAENQAFHQIGGHPYVVQNPMELECELVSNGIFAGDPEWVKRPDLEQHRQNSRRWKLLFQLDSDDEADMMWGDVGLLYFWIPEESLRARRFEDTWMILQCY